VGPFDLSLSFETSQPLGIHFIKPLGTKYFLILQNLTEWPLDESQVKEVFINEGRGNSPSHLKFFLLVFSKLKEDIK